MKNYILDTNVLICDPNAIYKFDENNVFISEITLSELDKLKLANDEVGINARKSIKNIWNLINENKKTVDVDIPNVKGKFTIINLPSEMRDGVSNNDMLIIKSSCKFFNDKEEDTILISNDINMRILAMSFRLNAQEYKNLPFKELKDLRDGKHFISISDELIDKFYKEELSLDEINKYIEDIVYPNDFILMKSFYDDKIKGIGIVKEDRIKKCKNLNTLPSGITPMCLDQKLAIELLLDPELELVTLSGKFGTSKTFTIIHCALELYNRGLYQKIYIVKAPIPLDKDVMTGFKPSDFLEKMKYPLGSITTNLENSSKNKKQVSGYDVLDGFITQGIIEIISLEDILGMSLNPNSILIIEEFEVMNRNVGLAVLSRIGENSKIFVNGDNLQSAKNHLLPEETALFHTINVFSGYQKAGHLTMKEIVRSGFCKELALRWFK